MIYELKENFSVLHISSIQWWDRYRKADIDTPIQKQETYNSYWLESNQAHVASPLLRAESFCLEFLMALHLMP